MIFLLSYWRPLAGAIGVVAIMAAFGLTYRAGYKDAEAKWNALALNAQLEAANRDLNAARNAANDAQRKATELDAAMTEANGRTEALEKELETKEAQAGLEDRREPVQPVPAGEPRVVVRTVTKTVPANCPAPVAPKVRPGSPYRINDDDVRRLR